MKLSLAAKTFDRTAFTDAYSGQAVFRGQLMPWDEAKRDAVMSERRTLSVAESVTIPARRAVVGAGRRYLLGHGTPDQFRGRTVRVGYVVQEAILDAQVQTLAEACLGSAGFRAYCNRGWVKNLAFVDQSSALPEQVHVTFAAGEPVVAGHLVTVGPHRFLVRQVIEESPAGFRICLSDEQPNPVMEVATVFGGAYDPVTETSTGSQQVTLLRLRWQSLFVYGTKSAPEFGPTDVQLVVAQSALTAKPGMRVTLTTGTYQLASVQAFEGVWLCRAVRHG